MSEHSTFLRDINDGLSQQPKYISSHYFYDSIGDKLFQQIMDMPEYYLTNSELEIFREQADAIIRSFEMNPAEEFELIELGAGDGKKTQHLLQKLLEKDYSFQYIPVDISSNSLNVISNRFKNLFPDLKIKPKQGEYFHVLDDLFTSPKPKIILFIGSNLGNMEDKMAKKFLLKIAQHLKTNEKLLLGLDLMKSRDIILPAYNDATGITRDFNLNLLTRINTDLGGNFNLDNFEHSPEYTEDEGIAKSFLKSKTKQNVYISALNKSFEFEKDELIHTEISRKYNDEILGNLLQNTQLEIRQKFLDSQEYFADYIITKK